MRRPVIRKIAKKRDEPRKFIPGVHFMPTDEVLIVHYLRKKMKNQPLSYDFMQEVDVYKYAPEQLVGMHQKWEQDGWWYFFTPRKRKYRNGNCPSRKIKNSTAGWKATGSDIMIRSSVERGKHLGKRKTLVYYGPDGTKSDWIMYEYLDDSQELHDRNGNMQLDAVVLCSIHKKPPEQKSRDIDSLDSGTSVNQNTDIVSISSQDQGEIRSTDHSFSSDHAKTSTRSPIMTNVQKFCSSNSLDSNITVHQNTDIVSISSQEQGEIRSTDHLFSSDHTNTSTNVGYMTNQDQGITYFEDVNIADDLWNAVDAGNATNTSISPEANLQLVPFDPDAQVMHQQRLEEYYDFDVCQFLNLTDFD